MLDSLDIYFAWYFRLVISVFKQFQLAEDTDWQARHRSYEKFVNKSQASCRNGGQNCKRTG